MCLYERKIIQRKLEDYVLTPCQHKQSVPNYCTSLHEILVTRGSVYHAGGKFRRVETCYKYNPRVTIPAAGHDSMCSVYPCETLYEAFSVNAPRLNFLNTIRRSRESISYSTIQVLSTGNRTSTQKLIGNPENNCSKNNEFQKVFQRRGFVHVAD